MFNPHSPPSFQVAINIHADGRRYLTEHLLPVGGPTNILADFPDRLKTAMQAAPLKAQIPADKECLGICTLTHTGDGGRFFVFFRYTPAGLERAWEDIVIELHLQVGTYLCGDSAYNQRVNGIPH